MGSTTAPQRGKIRNKCLEKPENLSKSQKALFFFFHKFCSFHRRYICYPALGKSRVQVITTIGSNKIQNSQKPQNKIVCHLNSKLNIPIYAKFKSSIMHTSCNIQSWESAVSEIIISDVLDLHCCIKSRLEVIRELERRWDLKCILPWLSLCFPTMVF